MDNEHVIPVETGIQDLLPKDGFYPLPSQVDTRVRGACPRGRGGMTWIMRMSIPWRWESRIYYHRKAFTHFLHRWIPAVAEPAPEDAGV